MLNNTVVIMIIFFFAFIPLIVAEVARNRSLPTVSDYFLRDRGMTTLPLFATIFATWMSAFALMGAISYFYDMGPIYMSSLGWDTVFALLFYLIGKRIWYYGELNGYITPTDFFHDMYRCNGLDVLVTVVTFIFTLLYIEIQMVGGIYLIQSATGGKIPWQIGGMIFYIILIIYLWAGGLRAVAMTDIFYGLLILAAIISSGTFLMDKAGGLSFVFSELMERGSYYATLVDEENRGGMGLWLSLLIIVPIGAFMGPQMWIRNYAAKSKVVFKRLPLFICIASVLCTGTMLSGSAGVVLSRPGDNMDTLIVALMLRYASPVFYTFIFVGIAAAIFSTANSQIHALSAIYTFDIHKKYVNKQISDRKLLKLAKWSMLYISISAYLLLLILPKSIFAMGVFAIGGTAQLFISVLGALFWKKSSAVGAVIGILLGFFISIALAFSTNLPTGCCMLIGLTGNAVIFIVVSVGIKENKVTSNKISSTKKQYEENNIKKTKVKKQKLKEV